jgi:drug/metabolite transporter (DMT)-like permease
MIRASQTPDAAASARLLVVVMGIAWGINWVSVRIILEAMQPWALRAVGIGLGAATLFVAAAVSGARLTIPRRDWPKVLVAGFFNVAAFGACSAYAQVYGTTARAVVIAYSMPIWASLLARVVLKERFNAAKLVALALCAAGLVTLIWPLARHGLPLGALFALGGAWSWAAGTIYLKSVKIAAPTLAVAAWQVLFGALMLAAGMFIFEGVPHLWTLPAHIVAWLGYNGLIGMGFAYFLWFVAIERLSTTTASLGTLLVPVVGVIASALMLGERPGLFDVIGFALIFAAAASVLLQPNAPHTEMPE